MSAKPRFGPHTKHSKHTPCPVCGGVTSRCLTFDDGATICGRIESAHAAGIGWLHNARARQDWRDRVFPITPPPTERRAAPPTLDAIYRRLLDLLPLSGKHHQDLHTRRMAPQRIADSGYGTLPTWGRRAIAAQLVREFGEDAISQTPGFYRRRDRHGIAYWTIAGKTGLLIPVRDTQERITGIQIRVDDPADKHRYQWLSSNGREGGTKASAAPHVARPIAGDVVPGAPVVISEGPLKADLAADALGCIVMALPGVSSRSGLMAMLHELDITEAIIAFDRDAEHNAAVMRARNDLAVLLLVHDLTIKLATWDDRYKGIDDVLAAGIDPTVTPYPTASLPFRSGAIIAIQGPTPRPRALRSLSEARALLKRKLAEAVADTGQPFARPVQIAAGTGIGKTYAVADLLTGWLTDDWPTKTTMKRGLPIAEPIRVLILAPTKELCGEIVSLLPPGSALLQEGRNPDPDHPWGCFEPQRIALAGAGRHNPHVDVCTTCAQRYGWAPGHPECGYLRSKKLASSARIVIAPADSYFNGSHEMDKFDLVFVDEGLFPFLLEAITVDRARVSEWRTAMDHIDAQQPWWIDATGEECTEARYPMDSPFRVFVAALGMLQAHCPTGAGRWQRALPVLREICPNLESIIQRIVETSPGEKTGRYPFEVPEIWEDDEHQLVPLRAIHELAGNVAVELGRDNLADTRLWLTPEGMLFLRPRRHTVDLLRGRKLVNLDATPHPALRFLLPIHDVIEIEVPAHQHVTQITDLLGTAKELAGLGNTNLERLRQGLEAVTQEAEQPVVFARKAFTPGGADEEAPATLNVTNPNVQWGWFDNQTRGLNKYAQADVLVTVGRYSHPIDRLRAEVMAARFSPEPAPAGSELDLLPYEWHGSDGRGKGRWTRKDADPDVNAAVRWSESSSILQAIGRGRSVNHPADDPLQVYVLSNLPIKGLHVDVLTTLEELGADPPCRKTPPQFYAARDERNAATERDVRDRVIEALQAIQAEGGEITNSEIARRSGVSRVTLTKNATLKAILQQARGGSNAITDPVNPSGDNDRSLSVQGFTGSVISPTPISDQDRAPSVIVSQPDIAPVKDAISAADQACERGDLQRATAELRATLAVIAERRSRSPVPKPDPSPGTVPS